MTSRHYHHHAETEDGSILFTASSITGNAKTQIVMLTIESALHTSVMVSPADASSIAECMMQAAMEAATQSGPTPPMLAQKPNGKAAR